MGITFTTTLDSFNELDDLLWSGAKDRWDSATDEQKQAVFDRLEEFTRDCISDADNPITLTTINDIIWFECDDIFFSKDDELPDAVADWFLEHCTADAFINPDDWFDCLVSLAEFKNDGLVKDCTDEMESKDIESDNYDHIDEMLAELASESLALLASEVDNNV